MRLLYLTDEIPFPPNNGIRIVSFNAMRLMRALGHDIHLCTLSAESGHDAGNMDERFSALSDIVSRDSWWMRAERQGAIRQVADTLVGKLTYLQLYNNKTFRVRVKQMVRDLEPDVVHFDYVNMTQYIDVLPEKVGSVASINDCHTLTLQNRLATASFPPWLRYMKRRQLKLTENYEKNTYHRFGCTHLMTEVDASYLRTLNASIRTCVIPNGVEDELFELNRSADQSGDIVFIGKLSEFNLYSLRKFVEEGWPVVRTYSPTVRLRVVGKITEEAESWVHRIKSSEPGIVFEGYVDKLSSAYAGAAISVAPLNKSAGILNKTIESMAAGVAVVGFSSVFEGMPVQSGVHCLSGDSYRELGAHIAALLDNNDLRQLIASNGRRLAEQQYAWPAKARQYEAMYEGAKELALG